MLRWLCDKGGDVLNIARGTCALHYKHATDNMETGPIKKGKSVWNWTGIGTKQDNDADATTDATPHQSFHRVKLDSGSTRSSSPGVNAKPVPVAVGSRERRHIQISVEVGTRKSSPRVCQCEVCGVRCERACGGVVMGRRTVGCGQRAAV